MRKILHIDMDAFFASVEQRDNPDLIAKPVIVGGKPGGRGVVAACSYEARQFGVHSAMPSTRAAKLCPNAIFLPARFDAYRDASQKIHRVFKQFTKLIEPLSLDEAYLDVTQIAAHANSATEVAAEIKTEIKRAVNLTASAGVSYNKFLAKIASDMDKPDGLFVIRPEKAQAFIEQLEIRKFFGVGKVTEKKMHSLGIYTGADLKRLDLIQLQTHFGKSANYYFNIARGIDERPVKAHRQRKSIGKETTFAENIVDKKRIWEALQDFADKIEAILENKNMLARTVTLKAKYANFQLITRSKTANGWYQSKQDIMDVMPELLQKTDIGKRPIRLIGLSLSSLSPKSQTDLEPNAAEEQQQISLFN
ncbi:MAG: DNA polymerase IV [Acidiferrobacterales bacterium]|nr:DNA polymerase IV [Acidiferrobacterales bacterium]